MTDLSRLSLGGLVSLSLWVTACQNETPAFTEQDMAAIAVSVSDGSYDNEARDNVFTIDDESSQESMDEETDSSAKSKARAGSYAGTQDIDDAGESDSNRNSADQDPEEASSSSPSSSDQNPVYGISSDDSKAIAKSCSQHFKGTASRIVVLSPGESAQSLTLSSQTVLAIRLTGNQQSLKLSLAAGQPLAGICLVLRGHESSIQLISGALVKKMVYLAAGDQSKGEIQFSNGLDASTIDLSGHEAQLNLRGVSSSVCNEARLRNHSARINCAP